MAPERYTQWGARLRGALDSVPLAVPSTPVTRPCLNLGTWVLLHGYKWRFQTWWEEYAGPISVSQWGSEVLKEREGKKNALMLTSWPKQFPPLQPPKDLLYVM